VRPFPLPYTLIGSLLLIAACSSAPVTASRIEPAPKAAPCAPAASLAALGDERARSEAILDMDPAAREELALALTACLGDPDPALRDGVAYTALSQMLRTQLVSIGTVMDLEADLRARLAQPADPNGFEAPFAALVLSEVARTDRITPWMGPEQRDQLIAATHAYLETLADYRGFSDGEGWRHGVAHAADILMQLSLNPQLTKPQAEALLAAIAVKVGTPDHAYVFGESERLAAPVTYLAFKETFTAEEWSAWFAGLLPPGDPLREEAYTSEAALTKLHNLRAFAQSVYINAMASNDDRMKPVAGAAFEFLNQLP
jgi:Protein of unknown function (DUF2785)